MSKRGTVEIRNGKDAEKWVVITDDTEREKHMVSKRSVVTFKPNEERMSCQWTAMEGAATIIVYFNGRAVFDRFVTLFKNAMAANIQ